MKQRLLGGMLITLSVILTTVLLGSHQARAFDPFKVRNDICTSDSSGASVCTQGPVVQNPIAGPNGILNKAVNLLAIVTGVASVVIIMLGGLRYVMARGDTAKIKTAKDTILYALIGLVIAAIAQAIVVLVLNKL